MFLVASDHGHWVKVSPPAWTLFQVDALAALDAFVAVVASGSPNLRLFSTAVDGAWSHPQKQHSTMAARRAFTALPTRAFRSIAQPCRSNSSSTSAMAYKAIHRKIAPLPTADTRSYAPKFSIDSPYTHRAPAQWSAAQAVSSILYETPLPSQTPPKRHVLNCLVQNEPGVLSRVSGILAARGKSAAAGR